MEKDSEHSINISFLRNEESKMPSMDGAIIIDKPAGMTSHDVVAGVRKILGKRRVGHTGTLDPFATGVLVILLGRATRLAQFLSGAEKEYEAVIRFGYATDTGDITGQRIDEASDAKARSEQSLRKDKIESAMESFRGEIEQLPPMYSAKRVAGRKLYEHARRGEEIERQTIRVTVQVFEPLDGELLKPNDGGSFDLGVRVVCSAGTYVRVLAEDLGKRMKVAAHLAALRRTRAGQFGIGNAVTLDELANLAASESLARILISPNDAVSHLPLVELDREQTRQIERGIDLQIDSQQGFSWRDGESIRLMSAGELIAVGKFDGEGRVIHPAVVLKQGAADERPSLT